MTRSASTGVRAFSVVLGLVLALGIQFMQPQGVGAQGPPVSPFTKAVCDIATTGTCPATTTTSSTSASTGDVVQYNLNFTNNSGAPATITITDQLAAGQTYMSCSAPAGGTCGTNAATPPLVTFTVPGVASGASGVVTIQVRITGSNTTIINSATASASTMPTTVTNSNSTTVTVGGITGGPGCLKATKAARDVTLGQSYGTSIYAFPGDLVRYQIVVYNGCGGTVTGVSISDPLQAGQTFSACVPTTCTVSANTVSFSVGDMPSGTSTTVYIDVTVSPSYVNQTITNAATASSTNTGSTSTNTTYVTVVTNGTCYSYNPSCAPPPCYNNPACNPQPQPCYYNPSCYTPPTYLPPSYTPSTASILICGVISAYTPAGAGLGYMGINGMTFGINPYVVPGGLPFTVGASFCVLITFTAYAQVGAFTVQPNAAGVPYVCGNLSPYSPGYAPYPGFNPYPGYNPNPGYGSYPGYGPSPYPGNPAMYGYGGPMMLGGYPFPVASGAQFPYGFSYGNPYCFLMNGGYVSGALSSVPVAATPAEDPAGVHRSGSQFAL